MRSQGGGGRQRGALATDDNAAGVRAGDREPGLIQTTGPGSPAEGLVPDRRTGLRRPPDGLDAFRRVRRSRATPARGRRPIPAGGTGAPPV
ncbi:hypothetical protein EW053_14170 [Streptomyces sp. IB2014 016-6]|nr:hypothetical protein EW053_14170 [Streptomyces sp. IB2014 016-6]